MMVVVRKHGFRLVTEAQEELNVSSCAQHGAGVELMGIGCDAFDFPHQRFSDPMFLVGRTHG